MLTPKMVPRLPIDSCEALFEKLKWDFQQLEKDWTSPYTTFNFVVTAYHLYQDWIKRAGSHEQRLRRSQLPETGKLLFNIWRDLTNATKHWELNDYSKQQQVVNDITGPITGDWYAFLISGPVFYIRVGGALPSLPELAQATISCFDWILTGENAIELAKLEAILNVIFKSFSKEEEQKLFGELNGR